MGQFFTLAPVPAGFRCGRSDYGATKAISSRYPASLIPLLELSRTLRSFPATLSLGVSIIRKAEGKGGLRDVR
ncbi:hypothetical protein FHU10_3807 [Serratia fonticola]|uniref:Uncharacterized protein n=1 Tax=Serratia fonticola TaxID=47917 RepID=A0A542BRR9_SERFO|nr:hypothetical protein FHU09_3900 [Serratia fonticola]TQI96692.1 hypothetical protein FHU11_2146 [Serratia fonticola]TVZ71189.1 hypothetical protein FHU10_3807 [Serratia fonticola]